MTTPPDHAAPGPCPVSPCDWDLEGTLDDHLYEHDYNELRPTIVRLARETDRLRAELEHERTRIAYWQDSRASYAAENKRLIGEKKQLRAELSAVHAFADRDQDGATCPHNVTGQLRQVLNAKLPKEG